MNTLCQDVINIIIEFCPMSTRVKFSRKVYFELLWQKNRKPNVLYEYMIKNLDRGLAREILVQKYCKNGSCTLALRLTWNCCFDYFLKAFQERKDILWRNDTSLKLPKLDSYVGYPGASYAVFYTDINCDNICRVINPDDIPKYLRFENEITDFIKRRPITLEVYKLILKHLPEENLELFDKIYIKHICYDDFKRIEELYPSKILLFASLNNHVKAWSEIITSYPDKFCHRSFARSINDIGYFSSVDLFIKSNIPEKETLTFAARHKIFKDSMDAYNDLKGYVSEEFLMKVLSNIRDDDKNED